MSQRCGAKEAFELRAEKIEEKKTVDIAIHDFTKRIDDQDNKKKGIFSPMFTVGDTSLKVCVHPQDWRDDSAEYIAVYLYNEEKENVTATFTVRHASGIESEVNNGKDEMKPKGGYGDNKFLSHEAYKEWAKDHGDVFKVELEITLHVEKPAQWTSNR